MALIYKHQKGNLFKPKALSSETTQMYKPLAVKIAPKSVEEAKARAIANKAAEIKEKLIEDAYTKWYKEHGKSSKSEEMRKATKLRQFYSEKDLNRMAENEAREKAIEQRTEERKPLDDDYIKEKAFDYATMILGPEEILAKGLLRKALTTGVGKALEKKIGNKLASKTIESSPVIENVNTKLNVNKKVDLDLNANKPWTINQPQTNTLQIKSTMSGSPLEKQLSKTGEINVNNIKAHIGKTDVGQQDKFILDKVLNEKFAGKTKIDYNEFRKAVSEELVPLERSFSQTYSNYGLHGLGYPKSTKLSYETAIENSRNKIFELENLLKNKNLEPPTVWENHEQYRTRLKVQLNEAKIQYAKNIKEYEELPIENQSLLYSNKSKFGRGNADHFDESTLGHARTLVSKEEPDVMHILEQQSDYFQKSEPLKLTDFNLERWKNQIAKNESSYASDLEVLKNLKEKRVDFAGNSVDDFQIKQFEDIINKKGEDLILRKGDINNPIQKEYLRNTHQERLLQENMLHAAEQGKSKMRYPTSGTAAKIQNYPKLSRTAGIDHAKVNLEIIKDPNAYKLKYGIINDADNKHFSSVLQEYKENPEEYIKKQLNIIATQEEELKKLGDIYHMKEHSTILKKYDEMPKMIKKVLGKEAKIVTDSKGNSWYEFDIPDAAKKGKFEMKALSLTGAGILGVNAMQQKRKGGLLYK